MPSWWDRFGEEWARQGLTDDPTFAQSDAGWAFIGQAPPTVEQFNTMFQWSDDKDNWLYGQIANCIIGSGVEPASNDLMQLWNAIKSLQRRKLEVDTAFYVDVINGNDATGSGEVDNPWKTINAAINYIYTYVDIAGRNCIIQLAPGTYPPAYHWQTINGNLIIQGDPLNPRAYIIKGTNQWAVAVVAAAVLYIQGVSFEATGPVTPQPYQPYGVGLFLDRAGLVLYDAIAFGPCTSQHIQVGTMGYLHPWRGEATTYSIYGGANYHIAAVYTGVVTTVRVHVTITGNPTFTGAYYLATNNAQLNIYEMVYTGTAVGTRYYVNLGGMLFSYGQQNIIPGTVAGVVDAASFGFAN